MIQFLDALAQCSGLSGTGGGERIQIEAFSRTKSSLCPQDLEFNGTVWGNR